MSGLVSVIIPVYNAGLFIKETIDSVINQNYKSIEIIIINDGSTDNSEEVIKLYGTNVLKYYSNRNQGVSVSRNFGLTKASGKYVLFLDADDIILPNFIDTRVKLLDDFPFFGFACGMVQRIDNVGNVLSGLYKSACNDIKSEVLMFFNDIVTCPSSYLFRRQELIDSCVIFNESLFSSADRFFLLQIDEKMKGVMLRNPDAALLYRIRSDSMSNKLDFALIKDNELFFSYVNSLPNMPRYLKSVFLSKSNYVLAGAYLKIGKYMLSAKFTFLSIMYNPANFISTLFKIEVDKF